MSKGKIKKIKAREILNSKGEPTVEVELQTDKGIFFAKAPAGTSKGKYEALEIRDGGKRYKGKGVLKAVENVNKIIAPEIVGKNPANQKEIDKILIELDGTENKSKLGSNALLPVSIAVSRAGSAEKGIPLFLHLSHLSGNKISSSSKMPFPCFNMINGGAHAGNNLDIQEFMVIPQEKSFAENLRKGSEIYHTLAEFLEKEYGKFFTNIGDEGGFVPQFSDTFSALNAEISAIKKTCPDNNVKIGIDCASTHFYKEKKYKLEGTFFTKEKLLAFYEDLVKKYPIIFLEDPFSQEDWEGFQRIYQKLRKRIIIVGDDLLASNPKRIKKAKEKNACNGLILKPDQIGTVSEAIESANLAKKYGWKIIVSHRSGDTCDDFIADFAVGIGADFIKSGAPARGERTAKYNRLLKIEEELKNIK